MSLQSGVMISIFLIVLFCLVTTVAVSWLAIPFTRRIGLIDWPRSATHKQHLAPTPLAGGIVILVVVYFASWMFGALANPQLRMLLLSSLVIFSFGLLDDFFNLPPSIKLVGQIGAAALLAVLGVQVQFFASPDFFIQLPTSLVPILNLLVTVFWMVSLANAFNFVDSMDGLAVGLGGVAATYFTLVSLETPQPDFSRLSAILIGICLGLYFFNTSPALLFLGDSGSQTLGFLLGGLAIIYLPGSSYQLSSWLMPVMVLSIPLFDTGMVILSRLRRKKPVYLAGRDHTYHRLIAWGVLPGRAVLIMHGAALTLGGLGFICLNLPPLPANAIFAAAILTGIWLYLVMDDPKRWH